ncbi:hypothetical protein FV226_04510 [Methylobacterium sp. WL12]|nr:hypothetical protein [Methylobacterium sp. WL12]TXM75249.1 hypothetical protein FV226_04510 [Methylobacterium sp. WL12]
MAFGVDDETTRGALMVSIAPAPILQRLHEEVVRVELPERRRSDGGRVEGRSRGEHLGAEGDRPEGLSARLILVLCEPAIVNVGGKFMRLAFG